jgi:hypothetical protein
MCSHFRYATVDELNSALGKRLAEPGYLNTYESEAAFERDVWDRCIKFMAEIVHDTAIFCLTSHTKDRSGRSEDAWKAFCREDCGPDVKVLDSNNRVDIVVKHPVQGSIGIEVKWLGDRGGATKLTQGLGQAMLALAHRDRTVLMIHCGTVGAGEREHLRSVADKICQGSKTSIIVVP